MLTSYFLLRGSRLTASHPSPIYRPVDRKDRGFQPRPPWIHWLGHR